MSWRQLHKLCHLSFFWLVQTTTLSVCTTGRIYEISISRGCQKSQDSTVASGSWARVLCSDSSEVHQLTEHWLDAEWQCSPGLQQSRICFIFTSEPLHNSGLYEWTGCTHLSVCHVQHSPPWPRTLQVLNEEAININQESEAHGWECCDSWSNTQDRNCFHWIKRHLFSAWGLCLQCNFLQRGQRRRVSAQSRKANQWGSL